LLEKDYPPKEFLLKLERTKLSFSRIVNYFVKVLAEMKWKREKKCIVRSEWKPEGKRTDLLAQYT